MTIVFYFIPQGQPSLAVWMTLEALGLDYEAKVVDFLSGEHKSESYKKITYLGQVPAITDGDLCLGESRAIATYLCNQYGAKQGKADLYPVDPKVRAVVDMHLYYDFSLYQSIYGYVDVGGVVLHGRKPDNEKFSKAKEAVDVYENFLTKRKYVAADHITIADFFGYVNVSLMHALKFDFSPYPKILAWFKRISELPFYEKTCKVPMENVFLAYKEKLKESI